jgi:hypothetical protein
VRFRFFAFAVACALCLLALPQKPSPAETQIVAGEIDFDKLHEQAVAALESLRQSSESNPASVADAAL